MSRQSIIAAHSSKEPCHYLYPSVEGMSRFKVIYRWSIFHDRCSIFHDASPHTQVNNTHRCRTVHGRPTPPVQRCCSYRDHSNWTDERSHPFGLDASARTTPRLQRVPSTRDHRAIPPRRQRVHRPGNKANLLISGVSTPHLLHYTRPPL